LGSKPEITRFKGLGEISPQEFARFIGEDIKLQPVMLLPETHIQQLLEYYMGKNSIQRQEFIIDNLKVELDLVEEVAHDIEAAIAEAEAEVKPDVKAGLKTKAKFSAEVV
jgi:topoisomerase-4 subunit B